MVAETSEGGELLRPQDQVEVAEEVDDAEEGAKADVFVLVVGGKVEVAVTEWEEEDEERLSNSSSPSSMAEWL